MDGYDLAYKSIPELDTASSSDIGDVLTVYRNGESYQIPTSLIGLVGGILDDVTAIDFDLTPSVTGQEGRLYWNADEGTLNLGMPGGNVNLQIGQESLIRGKAASGALSNGDLIYIDGGDGSNPTIAKAQANLPANSRSTLAMVTEDIANNQFGYATSFGLVRGVNTDPGTYTAGDILYLDATTAGAYTNVKPAAPNIAVRIGFVIRAHAIEGVIFVKVNQRTNNAENIRGLTAGQNVFADSNGFLDDNVTSRYTTTQTLDADDHVVFCDTDGGIFTVTLPASPSSGEYKRVINCGSSGNVLTIDGNSNNIRGSATQTLSDGEDIELVYETTEKWW